MTAVLASSRPSSYLDVANAIAEHLCETAVEHEGRIAWLGSDQDGDGDDLSDFTYSTIGPNLYEGTIGIALFLAEMYKRTGNHSFKATADGAVEYTLANWARMETHFRFSLYVGSLGAAYALARVGDLTHRDDFLEQARRVLEELGADPADDALLDVISGAAGAITPLLGLAQRFRLDSLTALAMRLGERILRKAKRSDVGWSWDEAATGFETPRDLTGFGHGAAGIGWSLLELYSFCGDKRFLEAASQAFRYERSLFLPDRDNWPDFRFDDGVVEPAAAGIAWCLGSPGIGLGRVRAMEIHHDAGYEPEIRAALRSVENALASCANIGSDDFSLCHGWPGIAEFLLDAARATGDTHARDLAVRIADEGMAENASTQNWHCGLVLGTSPSLMLGLAGIGYFYLRLADPTVPSVLLVRPPPRS